MGYMWSEIWGLIFPVCHCPSHFLSIHFFNWTADYLRVLKKVV